MRRFAAFFVAVAFGLGATALPAAAGSNGLNRKATGPFEGTGAFDFSTPACSFVHQVFDATYTTQKNAHKKHPQVGSFHAEGCVDFGPPGGPTFVFTGTFTLTT